MRRRIPARGAPRPEFPTVSHLNAFHAVRYRGIGGLTLDPLPRVNLITGSNGVGKTSVAEAIWLFNGRFAPTLTWNSHVQRSSHAVVDPLAGLSADVVELSGTERGASHRWKAAFESTPIAGGAGAGPSLGNGSRAERPDGDPQRVPVPVRGRMRVWLDDVEAGAQNGVVAQVQGEGGVVTPVVDRPPDHAAAVLHLPLSSTDVDTETINRFSEQVARGRKDDLKQALGVVLPLLADVEVITNRSGQPFILATTARSERLPLQALGGGMTRLFRLFVSFHEVRGGLVVVDEIENGLHHLVMPEFWRRIRAMTGEFDVQLFATTHSRECVLAALDAFDGRRDDLAIHSLYRKKGVELVEAATYTGKTLRAVRDLDLEVR